MVIIYLIWLIIFVIVFYSFFDIIIPLIKGTEPFSFFKKKEKPVENVSEDNTEVEDAKTEDNNS